MNRHSEKHNKRAIYISVSYQYLLWNFGDYTFYDNRNLFYNELGQTISNKASAQQEWGSFELDRRVFWGVCSKLYRKTEQHELPTFQLVDRMGRF